MSCAPFSADAEDRRLARAVLGFLARPRGDALAHEHRQPRLGVLLAVQPETISTNLPRLGALDRGIAGLLLVAVFRPAQRPAGAQQVSLLVPYSAAAAAARRTTMRSRARTRMPRTIPAASMISPDGTVSAGIIDPMPAAASNRRGKYAKPRTK